MKRGDFVECVFDCSGAFNVGKDYEVEAVEGDDDIAPLGEDFGLSVPSDGFIVRNEHGNPVLMKYPNSAYSAWKLKEV